MIGRNGAGNKEKVTHGQRGDLQRKGWTLTGTDSCGWALWYVPLRLIRVFAQWGQRMSGSSLQDSSIFNNVFMIRGGFVVDTIRENNIVYHNPPPSYPPQRGEAGS
jgi:hypothetical protein